METANSPFSWGESKEEIEQVYPEYQEVEKGSIPGLEKTVLLRAKRPIRANDYKGLQGWIRVYKGIIKQLMEPTARITNREAANGFLWGLTEELAVMVRNLMMTMPRET
jgi:hypothetical protein